MGQIIIIKAVHLYGIQILNGGGMHILKDSVMFLLSVFLFVFGLLSIVHPKRMVDFLLRNFRLVKIQRDIMTGKWYWVYIRICGFVAVLFGIMSALAFIRFIKK